MKKIISALLCIFISCTVFSGCKAESEDSTGTADTAEPYVYKTYEDYPSPISINGTEISYAEYRYYFQMAKYAYDLGYDDYWDAADDELIGKVKDEALTSLKTAFAVETCAASYGITLTDEEKAEIDELINNVKTMFENESEYYRYLGEAYLTEEVNLTVAKRYYLRLSLFEYLTTAQSDYIIDSGEEPVRRFIDKYLVYADRILISNDRGDDLNENETLINLIKQKLDDGEDFNELKEQYSDDATTSSLDRGAYFGDGDYDEYYYTTACSLKDGETSGIISTPIGYMIVKRMSFDEEYIDENISGEFTELYQEHMLRMAIQKHVDAQQVVFSDSYDGITINTIE